jgi:large subunit ribosomal protein L47
LVLLCVQSQVEESMKNLEEVVRERNRAYFLLETGETGERPGAEVENFLGLPEYQQHEEHILPKEDNKPYLKAKSEEPVVDSEEKKWFLTRFREKQRRDARKKLQ